MNILRQLRENRGRKPEELAKAAGITVEWYYDLEAGDDELDNNISVGSVSRIARELGVKPSALYGGASGNAISVHGLAFRILKELERSGMTHEKFADQIGYAIAPALNDPTQFCEFNAEGLRAACTAVNINWFDVLDHLEGDVSGR